jgi:penicillin amidase
VTADLWDELPTDAQPGAAPFLALLDDPANPWWDNRRTHDHFEQRDSVLADALAEAYRNTLRDHGPPEFGGWRWSRVHQLDLWHLLHIPGLSRLGLAVPGGPSTISPSSVTGGSEASSWRMVVELGPEVRAWGTYPGGQSGNPASPRYDDRIGQWTRGELAALRFPHGPSALVPAAELLLRSGR